MTREKALKDWCDKHYEDFGFYPFEFEYENKIYKIILPDFTLEEVNHGYINEE